MVNYAIIWRGRLSVTDDTSWKLRLHLFRLSIAILLVLLCFKPSLFFLSVYCFFVFFYLGRQIFQGFLWYESNFVHCYICLHSWWLSPFKPTCYATKDHSTSLQITASVSCALSTKTESHNVESFSKIRRTELTGNKEPYKHCYLSPYKPSVSSCLSVRGFRSFRPVNQNHIAVFSVQQGTFHTYSPGIFILLIERARKI